MEPCPYASGDAGDGTGGLVYMDYNATTPLHPEVIQAMQGAMLTLWGNPSSLYPKEVRNSIESSRVQVAALIGALPEGEKGSLSCLLEDRDTSGGKNYRLIVLAKSEEIIFTSSGTEADNWILDAVVRNCRRTQLSESGYCDELPRIIMSDIEHDAVWKKAWDMGEKGLCHVDFVSATDRGRIKADDVIALCRVETCLISIMLANNETGVIQPIEEIAAKLVDVNRSRLSSGLLPILFHTDAAQALGKIPVDVQGLKVDFLTIVGHKSALTIDLFPEAGTGQNLPILKANSHFHGGGQERGYRPGTENTVDIVGIGKAAEVAKREMSGSSRDFLELGHYLREKMKAQFGGFLRFNFAETERLALLPNTFSVHFAGDCYNGHEVLARARRLQASTGAACHSGMISGSPVLIRSGLTEEAARNTIRLSIGKPTTKEEIDMVVQDLRQAVEKIKQEQAKEERQNSAA